MYEPRQQSGFSLVEVVVVSAVALMVFGGLFASIQFSLDLVGNARARLSAVSLANDRLEAIRSLSYSAIGTVAGFPAGLIPQTSTTSLNGIEFQERVIIEYVDDPADTDPITGLDSNGITTDYKRVKVEYSWSLRGATSSVFLTSNIAPRSIETNVGGGTARINVRDATSSPLPGIVVRLTNDTGTTTYDVTRFTNATGEALFVAPAAASYEVQVGGSFGYTLDRTYAPTTTLPVPSSPPFAILEADVSTLFFQIDRVSNIGVEVVSDWQWQQWRETFVSTTTFATSSDVTVSGGKLQLLPVGGGIYSAMGTVQLVNLNPAAIAQWETATLAATTPAGTSYRIQFYTGTTPATLIPDVDLPGNSIGFTSNQIDLSTLAVSSYPNLTVGIILETSDSVLTPQIDEVSIFYTEMTNLALGEVVTLRNNKTIGFDAATAPIYKFSTSAVTDGSGSISVREVEWGEYEIAVAGHDVAQTCPNYPFTVSPGSSATATISIVPDRTHTFRLLVVDPYGQPYPGSLVTLQRPGFSSTATTSPCGQVFFSEPGLITGSDYTVEIATVGYADITLNPVAITGDTYDTVTLSLP